ncbi:hypothetical protein GCM10012275_42710 [Longimycelium tulufanense]|uniref:Uncharacterized protein n=1 Tax=Longimycelium tulufanense TaxID=907463 RepID=A0A8J3FXF1_9PSEU|nr:hypothetical protein [Longimycelium tulufanense]GGM67600.1 hypothetical protein GCM10012275_42710 [Longimycelium tulufanense]
MRRARRAKPRRGAAVPARPAIDAFRFSAEYIEPRNAVVMVTHARLLRSAAPTRLFSIIDLIRKRKDIRIMPRAGRLGRLDTLAGQPLALLAPDVRRQLWDRRFCVCGHYNLDHRDDDAPAPFGGAGLGTCAVDAEQSDHARSCRRFTDHPDSRWFVTVLADPHRPWRLWRVGTGVLSAETIHALIVGTRHRGTPLLTWHAEAGRLRGTRPLAELPEPARAEWEPYDTWAREVCAAGGTVVLFPVFELPHGTRVAMWWPRPDGAPFW